VVMSRLRARRSRLAAHDSAKRLTDAGVAVFFGDARFDGPRAITVGGAVLRYRRAVIATGTSPSVTALDGLESVNYLTSDTIFDLTTLPRRLIVIGAGAVGCETGQALARLGTVVTVVDRESMPLSSEVPQASAIVQRRMERDGVRFELASTAERVGISGGEVSLTLSSAGGDRRQVVGDALLVAAGRVANVSELNLDAAGIACDGAGIIVSDRLQTSNRSVFAAGDVCSRFRFTHAADAAARIVIQNALFFGRRRASALLIPRVTFTSPEVAHIGATHRDVAASDGRLSTITIPLSDVDRAVIDDETDGFVQVHHQRGTIQGCTIVAAQAGEMMGEMSLAMTHRHTLGDLSATVHAYPTQVEAFRKAGDVFRRQALTPGVRRWLGRYFTWTR
jgi:pyruvate/2-oxoglutarate dehydrogenase complex dihydrolipoamide dehydrogenase (E3) component